MEKLFVEKKAVIGIIGLGYVGLPLALAACKEEISVVGFDVDPEKTSNINAGKSYIKHIPSEVIARTVKGGWFRATTDFSQIAKVDAIIICVPTPLTAHREPNLAYVEATAEAIAPYIRRGHLVVLEFDHMARNYARGDQADSRARRVEERQRLLSRLLARARRSG